MTHHPRNVEETRQFLASNPNLHALVKSGGWVYMVWAKDLKPDGATWIYEDLDFNSPASWPEEAKERIHLPLLVDEHCGLLETETASCALVEAFPMKAMAASKPE